MHATATFSVAEFIPSDYVSPVTTGTPVGHAHMVKEFAGEIAGRSTTQFSYAFDPASEVGTYVAMEAFEGSVAGRTGCFAFAHSATTDGQSDQRLNELLVIAPGSGSGGLTGITGTGSIVVDEDGTHHLEIDYQLPAPDHPVPA
ncbi:MAG: DUF3224 domain-containing protein [Actinomycetota bacterium]|nr:DUF3224 domain-containing protein [Actinomycetota bacterium]